MLGGPPFDAGALPSAGTITITGGSISPSFVLNPTGAGGPYATVSAQKQSFNAGDTLSVTATGGQVPAFSGKTVTAPGEITLTAPMFDAIGQTSFSRATPLAVTWTGASSGSILVLLTTSQPNVRAVEVACIYPAPTGSASVPAAVLGMIDKADGKTISGRLGVQPIVDAPFTSGMYSVVFRARATSQGGNFTATD
jgi:hypothetical protein